MSRDRFVIHFKEPREFSSLIASTSALSKFPAISQLSMILYGRVIIPVQMEGKIVVQQYLVKEDGKWRVATGDQSTIRSFWLQIRLSARASRSGSHTFM
jgi:hypothetical protein